MPQKAKRSAMSAAHKRALAEGRAQSRAVKRYLEHLESSTARRGRRRDPAELERRLKDVKSELQSASALDRLALLQKRADLEGELADVGDDDDSVSLEKEFVENAKGYGERKGISYSTWRAAGVPARVLKAAGITRATS